MSGGGVELVLYIYKKTKGVFYEKKRGYNPHFVVYDDGYFC